MGVIVFHSRIVFYIILFTAILFRAGPHLLRNSGAGEVLEDLELSTLLSLCPGVDICDSNATSAVIKPNWYVGGASTVSCCQGKNSILFQSSEKRHTSRNCTGCFLLHGKNFLYQSLEKKAYVPFFHYPKFSRRFLTLILPLYL